MAGPYTDNSTPQKKAMPIFRHLNFKGGGGFEILANIKAENQDPHI